MAKEDIAPAYKLTCKTNSDAVGLSMHLEELGKPMDVRIGKSVYYSKEWWDKQMVDQDDFLHDAEDFAMVFETDYTPEVEVVDFDFEDHEEGFSPSFAESEP